MKTIFILLIFSLIPIIGFSQSEIYDAKYDITVYTTNTSATGELFIKNGNGNTFTGIMLIDGDERNLFGWYVEKLSQGGGYIYNTKGIVFYVRIVDKFEHLQLFKGLYNFDQTYISGNFFYWGNEFIFQATKSEISIPQDSTDIEVPVDTSEVVIPTDTTDIEVPVDTSEVVIPTDTTDIEIPNDSTIIEIPVDTGESEIQFDTAKITNNFDFIDPDNEIKINPNPFDNSITISSYKINLENSVVSIYNISGKLALRKKLSSNNNSLSTESLTKGTYILKIATKEGKEIFTQKLIRN